MNQYQRFAVSTAICDHDREVPYLSLALCGEAGEVADKVKKALRDNDGIMDRQMRRAIVLELGDCLYYLSLLAHEIGFSLSRVAELNHDKVEKRIKTDTLHGSGDYREQQ